MDIYEPTFIATIEGQTLSKDVTQEIVSFVFEDCEDEMDILELAVTNRNGQFTDDALFQEGNTVEAKFGYIGNMSGKKKCLIKEIAYDFPVGVPTITLKAYDQGCNLSGNEVQKVWRKEPPGYTHSEIAEEIAAKYGLRPVIEPTATRLLTIHQANESDARFLLRLAREARPASGEQCAGYQFYIEGDELHFHTQDLFQAPMMSLEYFGNDEGLLQSFQPETLTQTNRGPGTQVQARGINPRTREETNETADNEQTSDRPVLGGRTCYVDAETDETRWREDTTGEVINDTATSATASEGPEQPVGRDQADAAFTNAELGQVKATAVTIGIPSLRAKRNIEIKGVGRKFSGIYYIKSVRHQINESGYTCELKLQRNAVGNTAGEHNQESSGVENQNEPESQDTPDALRVDAETGEVLL